MPETSTLPRRLAPVPADAHYRRVNELLNYASDQVNRRRALARAIREICASGKLQDEDSRRLLAVVEENGGI
jgi:hypothetical protein